ncbi:glycosyltransferase [Methylocapsa acidiphila]|uniref:glycosyltransferase n=1 Tax=Methylocapsa acidiphila TaxID=133552 RepID=UPI0018DBB09A|nr:glycosyltransferase [Methylocapsa acidiphila]
MVFFFHGLVGPDDAANFLSHDLWRLAMAASASPTAKLGGLPSAFTGCALRLALRVFHALAKRVGAAPPFDRPRESFDAGGRPRSLANALARNAAREDEPPEQGLVYLDLSDVLCHAIWHDSWAGIPRVQLEIAASLGRTRQSLRVIALRNRKWRDLRPLLEAADGDVDTMFRLMRAVFVDFHWSPAGVVAYVVSRLKYRSLLRRAEPPEPGARDTVFIGGAFWIDRDIIEFCRRAADRGANLIVLLHDLIPLVTPYFTGHDFRDEYLAMLRLPAHFIVTTPRNRRDLESVWQGRGDAGPVARISIVHLADEFPGAQRNECLCEASSRLARLRGEDFALCVGTVEIRKNHLALLLAWEELAVEFGESLPKLVVAGRRGWKADAALARLDELDAAGDLVQFVEAPSDDELRWLYASCRFTVFPSYFEGWGLPVGESFWFGKACAASNAGSIPFVGRDLCQYFSPYDAEEMKAAVRALLNAETRRSFQAKIRATPLRKWEDVARDLNAKIVEGRPTCDASNTAPAFRAGESEGLRRA